MIDLFVKFALPRAIKRLKEKYPGIDIKTGKLGVLVINGSCRRYVNIENKPFDVVYDLLLEAIDDVENDENGETC